MAAGYNLLTYRADVLFSLEGSYSRQSSSAYPDAQVFRALNDAQLEVQGEFKVLQAVDTTTDVVADTMAYSLPNGIFGTGITMIALANSDGNFVPLDRISPEEAIRRYDPYGAGGGSGTPSEWTLDPNDPTQILLLPAPVSSLTDGLLIRYRDLPTPLYRFWTPTDHGATTPSGLAGGTTITLAPSGASVDVSNIAVGDEIGLLPTGSGDTAMPLRWYEITVIEDNDTYATLTTAEATEGASNQYFVTAQVSDLEQCFPGKMRNALSLLAAAKIREAEAEVESASGLRQRAYAILSQGLMDEDGTQLMGRRSADYLPGFFKNTWTS